MKYEAFTRECSWVSEPKGGFVAIADERRYEEHVSEFCDANALQPWGGVSVTSNGVNLLVTQVCIARQPGFQTGSAMTLKQRDAAGPHPSSRSSSGRETL